MKQLLLLLLLNLIVLEGLVHLEPPSDDSDVQRGQVALKVDPLVGPSVQCLSIELVLADYVLVVRLLL